MSDNTKRKDALVRRFEELEKQMHDVREVRISPNTSATWYPPEQWQAWATSVLNLLEAAFGRNSVQYQTFARIHENKSRDSHVEELKGVFVGAKSDFDGGYIFAIERQISGEIFGDLVALSKEALSNGSHQTAAVLACAALEDALKRYAHVSGLDVTGQPMQQVISALRARGLVGGAQKALLEAMPRVRNHAMHADWQKLTPADAASVIAFVEQFLLAHF